MEQNHASILDLAIFKMAPKNFPLRAVRKPFFPQALRRHIPRNEEAFLIRQRVRVLEKRRPALLRPEEFARPAQLQIFLGDDKSVARFCHDPQAFLAFDGFGFSEEETFGGLRASTDPSAHLMKLRQPESFRIFDYHHCGVRIIHADFDHRRGHKGFDLSPGESFHDGFPFPGIQPSVHESDFNP